jgi:lipopolysaccharide/colanic/teichoic acid biosynthesis glycosyltransferase
VTHRRYDHVKRIVDVTVAAIVLAVLLPLGLVIAIVVAATLGRPILFRQLRPGRHGTPFELVKFRTMRACDPATGRLGDGDRITRTGRLLRATSLDELPTMFNVLRGHMSLVGPRPLLVNYLPMYTPEQARRHEVRPGITGLAQVRGRNTLAWEQKFDYDVYYVDHRSAALDLRILAATVGTVLGRKGISAHGHVTAPVFTGTARPTQTDGPGGWVLPKRASA